MTADKSDKATIDLAFEESWDALEAVRWTGDMDKRIARQWFHLAWRACEAYDSVGESRIVPATSSD
jgi:hypothetical protein